MSFPDIPAGMGVPLVTLDDHLLPEPTMEALDDRYAGTGEGLPPGGSTGQVLTKQSGADADADWEDVPEPSTAQSVNAQTGTSYTPVLGDMGNIVTLSNASPVTVTMPQDSDLAIPVGGRVDFFGIGAGLVTFAAGTGATIHATPSLVTRAQYSAATAVKYAANTWLIVGDLA